MVGCFFYIPKHNREDKTKKKKTLKSSNSRIASKAEIIIGSSTVLSKDVMMDIFSRVPSKLLCKLRCVCKEWRSIINDPFFKSLHRARSSQKPNLIFVKEESCHRDIYNGKYTTRLSISSVDFDGNHNFDFTLTLHDLVNFLPFKGELMCFVGLEGFHVCNPTTQELVKLPNTSFPATWSGSAFGYVKERNEYIFVNACSNKYDTGSEVLRWNDCCCLKDLSWRVVSVKCPYFFPMWGVLIENTFYWVGCRNVMKNHYTNNNDAIVSFDLGKEEFGTVVLPEGPFDHVGLLFLVELKGKLCLVDSPMTLSTMNIWVLKDSKCYMWAKEYNIDLNRLNLISMRIIIPLDHREGRILMYVKEESVEWYDVENKCFERIDNLRSGQWRSWCGLYTDGWFSLGSRCGVPIEIKRKEKKKKTQCINKLQWRQVMQWW